jgi:lipid-A-disaccharide synthase
MGESRATRPSQDATDRESPHIAMVAGEASGDLLAGLMLGGLRARWPQLQAVGIGGPQMARHGFDAWWPHHKLTVHGFGWDLLRRYREIVGIRNQLQARLLADKPDVFIGVDAPDFNLDLERNLRQQGVPTVHFVCPSIWAWRAERVEKIRASVDHVLCIFPFEPELLASHGIAATYVGHPLANVIPLEPDRAAARTALGLGADDTVLAILPGSRASEVRHLASCFFEAAALVKRAQPAIKLIVPSVPALRGAIERAAAQAGLQGQVQIVDGQSHAVLAACDLTLIASGTATLEAALFKRPMVIAYRMGWMSWRIMRGKQLQPWVGLPNILSGDFVVPELIQERATPRALADALLQWLDALQHQPAKIAALQQQFTTLHHSLRRDTSALATDAIEKILAR